MNKQKKKLIVPLLLFLTFLSCSENNEILKSPLIGEYKLFEYKSNTGINLNNDGIKIKDLLEGLEDFYFKENRRVFEYFRLSQCSYVYKITRDNGSRS